jgi:hypothetical protein
VGGVLQCPFCDEIFDASPAARADVAGSSLGPRGASVVRHAEGLEVRLPWRHDLNVLGYLVHLFLVAAGGYFTMGLVADEAPALAVGSAAATLFLCYNLVYTMVNRTTLLITPRAVAVRHGPLPSFSFSRTFPARQLRVLTVAEVVKGFGRSKRTVYELTAGATADKVLSDWNHRDIVDFARARIEEVVRR